MNSSNIKKLNRLLYLLNRLGGTGVRVQKESRELDVTERTIQRDLRDIEMGGFPIYKAPHTSLWRGFHLKKWI